MGDGAGRGRGFGASRERFHLAALRLQILAELAQISLQKEPQKSATIFARSATIDHDRASIVFQMLRNCRSMVVEWIPRGRSSDCGSIAPRSRFDRTAIVVFFNESSGPSDMAIVT